MGDILSSSSTTQKDKWSWQEQSEMHDDDGENVEMGLESPKQAVLEETKNNYSRQLKCFSKSTANTPNTTQPKVYIFLKDWGWHFRITR